MNIPKSVRGCVASSSTLRDESVATRVGNTGVSKTTFDDDVSAASRGCQRRDGPRRGTPTIGRGAQVAEERRGPVTAHRKIIHSVRVAVSKYKMPEEEEEEASTSRGEKTTRPAWDKSSMSSGTDLVLTPRDEKNLGTMDAEHTPATVGSCATQRTTSTDRSESEDHIWHYEPFPSIEERLRLIMEERQRRLDEMQQKLARERADVLAPRPKTLVRCKNGSLRAILGHRNPTDNTCGAPLSIQYHRNKNPEVDTFGSGRRTSYCSAALSRPCEQLFDSNAEEREELREEGCMTPLEIDKGD